MTQRTKKEIRNLAERVSLSVTPYDWLKKAQTLRQASNHLLIRFEEDQLAHDEQFERNPDFDLELPDCSVLMMLLGFAIENLLKGLYVSTLPIVKSPRTLKELGMPSHALAMIASKIDGALGEQFSERELDILVAIEQSVLWCGRDPSPVDADKLISPSTGTLFSKLLFRYPVDHFDACTLYDRLESLLIPRAPFSIQRMMLGNKAYVGQMSGNTDGSEQRKA
jgi:hypothetical protein